MNFESKVFKPVRSDSVIDIAGVKPATFIRPSEDYILGKPKALQQDSMGYLVPDPALAYRLYQEGQEFSKKPLALTRQSREMLHRVVSHQDARSLDGIHQNEKYLVLEGAGGIGKSYTIQCLFGRLGVPIICDKIPPDIDAADEVLFGNPQAINPNPNNLIETTRAIYNGRGFRHPETVKFLKTHPKELYQALHPGPEGWYQKDPASYCNFWKAVASVEGVQPGQKTIPVMGLLEKAFRNGFVLFLDEMNRIKKGTLDLCMRAFEEGKHLETNIGVLLASEKHPGSQLIAAQNGAEPGYSVAGTDRAHLRRQKKPPIPCFDQNDYREYLYFLMTGESVENKAIKLKGDTEDKKVVGASCTKEYIECLSTVDGKKVAQKDRALSDIAGMHLYMETQINQAIKGEGWMESEEVKNSEMIAVGPSLLKEFIDRTYQLVAYEGDASCGLLEGIERASQAFKEVYIDPLEKRGIPMTKIASLVNFGTFGDQQAQGHQVSPVAIGHFVSMFCPMRGVDLESLGDAGSLLNKFVEEGGVYPGLDSEKKPLMLACIRGKDKVKVVGYTGNLDFVLIHKARRDFTQVFLPEISVDFSEDKGFSMQ